MCQLVIDHKLWDCKNLGFQQIGSYDNEDYHCEFYDFQEVI